MTMTSWRIVRMFAGIVILVSLALGVWVNSWWLLLTAFVGANLLQSSLTKWCPLEIVLRKLGVQSGC
jgi:fatty acid desaturase